MRGWNVLSEVLREDSVALIMAPEVCCKAVKKLALSGGLFFACDSGVIGVRRIRDSFLLPHEKVQEAGHDNHR